MVQPLSQLQPVGPEVDATPRPVPPRIELRGRYVCLEPLGRDHAAGLWQAIAAEPEASAASFTYLQSGPFKSQATLEEKVVAFATQTDPIVWSVVPVAEDGRAQDGDAPDGGETGQAVRTARGWMSLMDIQPANAAIEIGNIWFAPSMQRSRAGTEALYLLLRFAADTLGYRRLVWKCHALNAPSRRAAERFGFRYEGTLRAHMVVKGRERDTAQYSLLAAEWPDCRAAAEAWLRPENFDADGRQRRRLSALRAELASRWTD